MTETDPNRAMNRWIRLARGYTPSEVEQPSDEEPARTGDANLGVRPLPPAEPDMNAAIRAAASGSRYDDGTQPKPIPR